ncbi:hypothetical protein ACP4OV_020883 [Aristida adscensionis]
MASPSWAILATAPRVSADLPPPAALDALCRGVDGGAGSLSTLIRDVDDASGHISNNEYLAGVDMRAKKVVEFAAHELADPSPSSVVAWPLPPTLTTAGPAGEVSDDGVSEDQESATAATI